MSYYIKYNSNIIKNNHTQCTVNFNNAINDKTESIQIIVAYMKYVMNAFTAVIPNLLRELDLQWQTLIYSMLSSFVITIIVQGCMYFVQKIVVFICGIGIFVGVLMFIIALITNGAKAQYLNTKYYELNGYYDTTYIIQAIIFYVLAAVAILVLLVLMSMSYILLELIKSIEKTIKVVGQIFKKIWPVVFIAFVMMIFCICHIIFFAVVIFTNLAGSTFDAQLITF